MERERESESIYIHSPHTYILTKPLDCEEQYLRHKKLAVEIEEFATN
jgi:hypothetical protein